MKNTYLLVITAIACCALFMPGSLYAQSKDIPDPTLVKPPHVIIQTGVSSQWLGGATRRSFVFSVERPFQLYQHLGLEVNLLFPEYTSVNSYFYEPALDKKSFEVGLFYKLFLNGRLTGRKSTLYVGPELKIGRRNFVQNYYTNVFPFPDQPSEVHFYEKTTKIMIRCGAQYQIGPAILELAMPIAVEWYKKVNGAGTYQSYPEAGSHLLFLPTLQLGVKF